MTGLWAAVAVVGAALVLLLATDRTVAYEAGWVRRVARRADPTGDALAGPEPESSFDLAAAEQVPEAIRALCPPPPFTAFVYHHTCGSCRSLWAATAADPGLADVALVHDPAKADQLRTAGVYRQPAVALPAEVMDELPSGLALRVEADWRIAQVSLVGSVAELRAVHEAAALTP